MKDTARKVDVLIIGAGQAGLAAAWHLRKRKLSFLILEADEAVGGSWKHYYDSLVLFSPARYSSLPGMRFPRTAGAYPVKEEVISYLQRYAEKFQFPVKFNCRVASVNKNGDLFTVHTEDGDTYLASSVIVASGGFATPYIPEIEGMDGFSGEISHAYSYKNPAPFLNKKVLVVGGGNSGVQIAYDLAPHINVTLATKGKIPFYPKKTYGIDNHFWLWFKGLDQQKTLNDEGGAVIDDGTYQRAIANCQIKHQEMFDAFYSDGVVWADGRRSAFDAIIFATGYRPTVSYLSGISGALNDEGRPVQEAGISTNVAGLYYVGIPKQRNFASATLRGVGPDAEYIMSSLKEQVKG